MALFWWQSRIKVIVLKSLKIIFILVLLQGRCDGLYGQPLHINFHHYTIDNGLSQNFVSSILQDSRGFMWFGTKDGLNRYDGYTFKTFRNDNYDTTLLSDNFITCMYEDSRKNLWIGTRIGGLNYYRIKYGQFVRIHFQYHATSTILSNYIRAITIDKKGRLWIGLNNGKILRITIHDVVTNTLRVDQVYEEPPHSNELPMQIQSLFAGDGQVLWIGTNNGLRCLDMSRKDAHIYMPDIPTRVVYAPSQMKNGRRVITNPSMSPVHKAIPKILQDSSGNLWMASPEGIYLYDRKEKHFVLFEGGNIHIKNSMTQTISIRDIKGQPLQVWAGLFGGLGILDMSDSCYHYFSNDPNDKSSISGGAVISSLIDREGMIWLGTNGEGISAFAPHLDLFTPAGDGGSIKTGSASVKETSMRAFCEMTDAKGKKHLYLGAQNGLYEYNFVTESLRRISKIIDGQEMIEMTYSLASDNQGHLLIGCGAGFFIYSINSGKIDLVDTFTSGYQPDRSIYKIYVGADGKVWFTTAFSLGILDLDTKKAVCYDYRSRQLTGSNAAPPYSVIYGDMDGSIWVGTLEGLFHFNPQQKKFVARYQNNSGNRNSLSFNVVNSILPDPQQPRRYLWIGTAGGGLNRFDKQSGQFLHFSEKDGLANNMVYGILNDKNGNLWMSTNRGLSEFDPSSQVFTNYDVENGLQSNEFNTGAFYKSPSGELFFGGIKGFNSFYGENILLSGAAPPVIISGFGLLGSLSGSDSLIERNIMERSSVQLNYLQNNFTVSLASLDFSSPEKNKFAYRIYNKDTSWIPLGSNHQVVFTNLAPGKYIIQARTSMGRGDWSETPTTLTVIISPPWWKTWWAYSLYVLAALAILYYWWQYNNKRVELKHKLEFESLHSKKLMELDHMKSRFFANISHEFRTPLTLIIGPLEDLLQTGNFKKFKDILPEMYHNSKRLLGLINQLLDLSRLDSGNYPVATDKEDIILFVTHIVHSFSSWAERKKIVLETVSDKYLRHDLMDQSVRFYFDGDIIEKVLSNLITNAIKFTPEGGQVTVSLSVSEEQSGFLELKVKDSGAGIESGDFSYVFNRFYRVNNSLNRHYEGSGIGLALVKELVEMHGGKITVASQPGQGTSFQCYFPFYKKIFTGQHKMEAPSFEKDFGEKINENKVISLIADRKDLPVVLIVEDQKDVRKYILEKLVDYYNVLEAENGKEGFDVATDHIPDLVISDVMMPEMDGFELCGFLKKDHRTSHIPVILLTARAEDTDKIAGLESRADAYLIKPFNSKELLIRVHNLIELRNKLRAKFSDKLVVKPSEITVTSQDSSFMQRLLETVEQHLDDERFSVEQLGSEFGMSPSQINRKLKAIINQSAVQFIRSIRMQRAMELLKNDSATIAEVAYLTGFNEPAYFSRSFKNYFGYPPSQIRKDGSK
ncbi:MAG: two-component regulator propeller domain-containing protein [Ginsengibacter sp.]